MKTDRGPQPLVSVVMGIYNCKRYISTTLKSVLRQTYTNIEIVIIDDASTDGTWERIRALKDPRVRSFRLERHSGVAVARNAALSRSRGEFITVFDGDDVMRPDAIKKRVEFLVSHARAMGAFGYVPRHIDGNGDPVTVLRRQWILDQRHLCKIMRVLDFKFAMKQFPLPPCMVQSVLFRKELLDLVGFFDPSLVIEDIDFTLRLLEHSPLFYIDIPIFDYRFHSGSRSEYFDAGAWEHLYKKYRAKIKIPGGFSGVRQRLYDTMSTEGLIRNHRSGLLILHDSNDQELTLTAAKWRAQENIPPLDMWISAKRVQPDQARDLKKLRCRRVKCTKITPALIRRMIKRNGLDYFVLASSDALPPEKGFLHKCISQLAESSQRPVQSASFFPSAVSNADTIMSVKKMNGLLSHRRVRLTPDLYLQKNGTLAKPAFLLFRRESIERLAAGDNIPIDVAPHKIIIRRTGSFKLSRSKGNAIRQRDEAIG